jgi:hypothetical protein
MKNIVFGVLAVFFGCNQEDPAPSLTLEGQWEWKSTCGGIVGCEYSSDSQHELLIINASAITIRRNGHVIMQSKYTINKASSPNAASRVFEISYLMMAQRRQF